MRKAAGDETGTAGLFHRGAHITDHGLMKRLETIPGHGCLKCIDDDPEADEDILKIRRLDERVLPDPGAIVICALS